MSSAFAQISTMNAVATYRHAEAFFDQEKAT
jgi:hypothetical protein